MQVMDKINNPHYLYRMTVLVAISLLAPVVGSEATCQTMLPVVINAAKDRFTHFVSSSLQFSMIQKCVFSWVLDVLDCRRVEQSFF
jgi:hypothetical protein